MSSSDAENVAVYSDIPGTPESLSPTFSSIKAISPSENKRRHISSRQTVVILDWDDTLLPSSWITQSGHRLDSPLIIDEETRMQLEHLESSVMRLLSLVTSYGTCIIITNAETGWVELSCSKFFPNALPIIDQLKIVSARSSYECLFPNSPLDWKYAAFSQEIEAVFEDICQESHRNILSVGDSFHEREAVHLVTSTMRNVHTKSIKFVERPSIKQLHSQVNLMHEFFDDICHHGDNLDLMLSLDLIGKQQQQYEKYEERLYLFHFHHHLQQQQLQIQLQQQFSNTNEKIGHSTIDQEVVYHKQSIEYENIPEHDDSLYKQLSSNQMENTTIKENIMEKTEINSNSTDSILYSDLKMDKQTQEDFNVNSNYKTRTDIV